MVISSHYITAFNKQTAKIHASNYNSKEKTGLK